MDRAVLPDDGAPGVAGSRTAIVWFAARRPDTGAVPGRCISPEEGGFGRADACTGVARIVGRTPNAGAIRDCCVLAEDGRAGAGGTWVLSCTIIAGAGGKADRCRKIQVLADEAIAPANAANSNIGQRDRNRACVPFRGACCRAIAFGSTASARGASRAQNAASSSSPADIGQLLIRYPGAI
jgi:hypothetical protein